MPRDVLLRVLYRRALWRARFIRALALLLVAAAMLYFAGREWHGCAYGLVALVVFLPWFVHRFITNAIDNNSQFTDAKTLTFTSAGLVIVGPNYRSELAWSMFKAFAEDDAYFYLSLTASSLPSVLPKAAFTTEQQQEFRQYALAAVTELVRKA